MAKVTIDPAALTAAAKQAFKDTCFVMGRTFSEAISDSDWAWPTAPTPRDIVDTGQLRSSQNLTFLSDSEAVFSWNTDYALYVHEGYTTQSGNTFPGRPWVTKALEKTDPQKVFASILPTYL